MRQLNEQDRHLIEMGFGRQLSSASPSPEARRRLKDTALGRVAIGSWMTDFTEAFQFVTPPSMKLKARLYPGITYVGAADLARLGVYWAHRNKAGEMEPADAIAEIIEVLGKNNKLNADFANQDINNVPFNELLIRKSGEDRYHLSAKIGDIASEAYPSGCLIQGERKAIATAILGENKAIDRVPDDSSPTHKLVLGSFRSNIDIPPDAIEEIISYLPKQINLGPIGPIAFEYY